MNGSIKINVSADTPTDAMHLLDMFVAAWLENDCISPVVIRKWDDPVTLETVYEIYPESSEDELWLRLKGIPHHLGDYITLN